MKMNNYYLDDAMRILPSVKNDVAKLVFTSPPGIHQTPFWEKREVSKFYDFLVGMCGQLARITVDDGFIVMSQRNSKSGSRVVDVRTVYVNTFLKLGYRLMTEKIIVQERKSNMWNFTFQHFLVFTKTGRYRRGSLKGEYLKDVVFDTGDKVSGQYVWTYKFVKMIIDTFTDEGDLIVDPFAGVGVVYHVARHLGRKCFAVEIDEETYNSGYRISSVFS